VLPDLNTSVSDATGAPGVGSQIVLVGAITSRSAGISDDSGARRPWLAKLDFPRFDGTDVRIWLDKCIAYFTMFQIPEGFKVTAATMYLDGRTAHWFQAYEDSYGVLSWDQFQSGLSRV
jgi:hypothetical protein